MSKSVFPLGLPCEVVMTASGGKKTTIEVLSALGGGGYNNAYRAHYKDKPTEEFVLKIYVSEKKAENHESQILSLLRRQGANLPVVRIIDPAVSIDGQQGHLESLARGKKLQDQLPSPRQALSLAIGLAKLLKSCAVAEIAYRDIKPGDHIFWEPGNDDSVESMTVIDWNISQCPAKVDALYFDLVKFCNSLPEFFVGKPPQGMEYYHPLAWQYDTNLQERISPKLWTMLANLSMNFVVPIISNGENLLAITNLSSENIIQIWDKVIENLNSALEFLDGNEFPDLGFKDMPEYQAYLQKFPDALDKKEIEKWTGGLVYGWVNNNLIREPDKRVRQRDTEDMVRLRLARLFNPGNFRETILLSLFVALYRTGVYNDAPSRPIYLKLLQGLLDQQAPSLFYVKEEFQVLISSAREKANQIGVDAGNINGAIWESLSKEFEIWIAYEYLKNAPNEEKRANILQGLDNDWWFHPAIASYANLTNREQGFADKKKEIEEKLNQPNLEAARMLAGILREIDADAATSYTALIEICERLQSIDSNDQNNPDAINQLIQDVENSPIPLPLAFYPQYQSLRERLSVLNKIKAFQADIRSVGDLKQLRSLYAQMDELKIYEVKKYPGIARLKDDWSEKSRRVAMDKIEELNGDQQKVSNSLNDLVKQTETVPETIKTAIQPAFGEIKKLNDSQQNIVTSLAKLAEQIDAAPETVKTSMQPALDEIKSVTANNQRQLETLSTNVEIVRVAVDQINTSIKEINDTNAAIGDLSSQITKFGNTQRLHFWIILSAITLIGICVLLSGFFITKIGNGGFVANPTVTTIPTTVMTIPTLTPLPINTVTPIASPTMEQAKEKILKTGSIFLADDKITQLWQFNNPNNLGNIKVLVLKSDGNFSFVEMQIIVSINGLKDTTVTKGGSNIRTPDVKVNQVYAPIGIVLSDFQIQKNGNPIDIWQLSLFKGWVSNESLQSE